MDWIKIAVLGVVEGLTEFLPVSSTGRLIVSARALRFEHSMGGTFEIFIQLGAILAVVGYYLRDLWAQALAVTGRGSERADVAGELDVILAEAGHHWIKAVLFRPTVIGVTLILGGIVFLIVERTRREAQTGRVLDITPRQALWVGVAQTLALVPGVSRSGASIVGAMLVGMDRAAATTFSFFLAIPTLGGATVVDLLKSLKLLQPGDLSRLAVGTAVSMVIAWLSIGWLLRYVSRRNFIPFGYYRILAGAAVLALALFGVLGQP